MKLNIISPLEKKSLNISWIEVNTSIGNFVIQAGHAPTIFILKTNTPITYALLNGKKENFIPKAGILEVTRQMVNIIINN